MPTTTIAAVAAIPGRQPGRDHSDSKTGIPKAPRQKAATITMAPPIHAADSPYIPRLGHPPLVAPVALRFSPITYPRLLLQTR
jgi:hypothetical protein